jgi:hypothetical protein
MSIPPKANVGETIVFSIATHNTTTGILTDADSAPTYRVYEEETATPITNGTMAKLDDANTTGHYSESLSIAFGTYTYSKTYTIYIEATVNSITGGIAYAFKARTLGFEPVTGDSYMTTAIADNSFITTVKAGNSYITTAIDGDSLIL